jgi:carbonic anhydrase
MDLHAAARVAMNRRPLLLGAALACVGGATGLVAPAPARAVGSPDPADLQARLLVCTPADALTRLKQGNGRFVQAWTAARAADDPGQRMQRLARLWQDNCQIDPLALAEGQRPFAAVLSCADSRVDPGWLFACGSGELFQVRSAGNTAFAEAVASLEYAVGLLAIPLVVVLGHSDCGAVRAALGREPLTPLLQELLAPIRAGLPGGDDLTLAVQANVRRVAADLGRRSELLRTAEADGRLQIIGAYADIGSGLVTLL